MSSSDCVRVVQKPICRQNEAGYGFVLAIAGSHALYETVSSLLETSKAHDRNVFEMILEHDIRT